MALIIGGALAGLGSLTGGLLGQQSAPQIAPYIPVNAQNAQSTAIAGDQASEGNIETLLSQGNAFTANQALSLMNTALPGYSQATSNLMNQANALATNPYQLPAGMQSLLQSQAAQNGVAGGTMGAFNSNAALDLLGTNELQYGQQNLQQAQSMYGLVTSLAPKVNPMSPMSMYVSPQQQIGVDTQNSQGQQATTQAGYNATAAASNANASMWGSIVSSMGGMFGGMAGAGAFGSPFAATTSPGAGGTSGLLSGLGAMSAF